MPGDESALSRFAAQRPRFAGLLAGFAFGLLMTLAFPPLWWWGVVFVAPLPLVWLSWVGRARPLTTAFWCAIGVSPWWGLAQIWVIRVSAFGWFPMVVILAALTGLAVWVAAASHRRLAWTLVIWPVFWVGLEFFRGSILAGGYAWYLLGHPLAGERWLAWPAAIVGTYGVSLLAALPATAVVCWWVRRRTAAMVLAAVAAAWTVVGIWADPWPEPNGSLRVGVVQTNVPQSVKIDWGMPQRYVDWQEMKRLIRAVGEQQPDLIVLPEAMSPGWTLGAESLRRERREMLQFSRTGDDGVEEVYPVTLFADELMLLQGAMDIPIVIGGPGFEGLRIRPDDQGRFWYEADKRYNSVFLIEGGRPPTVRYDKVALTPFGEYMPYISAWPWLEKQLMGIGASGMQFDLNAGTSLKPLRMYLGDGREVDLATPVCFEATMPSVCRRLAGKPGDAEVMINLTNDGWFGWWMPGREHHKLTARWRCLELGVPMIRAANTGISCGFDERGRLVAEGVREVETGAAVLGRSAGTRVIEIPTVRGRTIYARIGDVLGWVCLGLSGCVGGAVLALALVRGRSNRQRGPQDEAGRLGKNAG